MDAKTWSKFLYRTRILNRVNIGTASISRIVAGANLNWSNGRRLIHLMEQEGLITLTPHKKMKTVDITPLGYRYLVEFKRFCDVIETLKKDNS